ncbi:hypothetical protein B9479_003737 [Cryptococcus floricola]|uniref:Uncharacterized protein n=1 Tax=Cryptococcus floricola TaxID=2591691 RepID=A0A5D3AVZ7_9TREE|nr:hypothetical protein B9479_003737 [Cryptococcus floricola]
MPDTPTQREEAQELLDVLLVVGILQQIRHLPDDFDRFEDGFNIYIAQCMLALEASGLPSWAQYLPWLRMLTPSGTRVMIDTLTLYLQHLDENTDETTDEPVEEPIDEPVEDPVEEIVDVSSRMRGCPKTPSEASGALYEKIQPSPTS